jgi:hypothetical protein
MLSRWGVARETLPLERLESMLHDQRRYDIVAALKELEKAKLGELSVGRKGHKSQFTWAPSAAVAQRSRTLVSAPAPAPEEDPASGVPTSRSNQSRAAAPRKPAREPASRAAPQVLEHAFHVRPHVMATFRLPADVTRDEIERLCQLLQAIPFR